MRKKSIMLLWKYLKRHQLLRNETWWKAFHSCIHTLPLPVAGWLPKPTCGGRLKACRRHCNLEMILLKGRGPVGEHHYCVTSISYAKVQVLFSFKPCIPVYIKIHVSEHSYLSFVLCKISFFLLSHVTNRFQKHSSWLSIAPSNREASFSGCFFLSLTLLHLFIFKNILSQSLKV